MIILASTDSRYVEHYYHGALGTPAVPQIFSKISDYYHQSVGDFSDITFYPNISAISANGITGIFHTGNDSQYKMFTFGYYGNTADGRNATLLFVNKSKGHPIACRNVLIAETEGYINPDNIFAAPIPWNDVTIAPMLGANGFKIAVRSTSSLDDNIQEGFGQQCWNNGVGVCWAHYSNQHYEVNIVTKLDLICVVGYGNETGNNGSYGNGLEFYTIAQNQSYATPRIAGMIAKLMTNHPTWNFHDARQALRQTASNWNTGWIKDGGFGLVDYEKANALTDKDLLCMSPLRQKVEIDGSNVILTWKNCPQNMFGHTVIAKYYEQPNRDTVPTNADIIYSGTDEIFVTNSDSRQAWFVFYTVKKKVVKPQPIKKPKHPTIDILNVPHSKPTRRIKK